MLGLTQQQMADKLDISLQSYNNKETKKTAFNDKERLVIKSMVAEIKPDITIDELFYSQKGANQSQYYFTFTDFSCGALPLGIDNKKGAKK